MTSRQATSARLHEPLIPRLVDTLAREVPQDTFGVWPRRSGYYTVTYGQFANAVNGLAWWLVRELGPEKLEGVEREVIVYVGPNDLRYSAILLAAVKAGYGVSLPYMPNSPAAHRALCDRLKCRTLATTDPALPAAATVIDSVQPRIITTPSLEELLETKYPDYVYDICFEQAKEHPLFIVHTSGSTGIPKPMVWTQEAAAHHLDSLRCEPPSKARSLDHGVRGKRVMITLPPFHGAGLSQYIFNAVALGMIPIIPSVASIPTAEDIVNAMREMPTDMLYLAPSVVTELAQRPDLLDYCAQHLDMIIFIGGDLPQAIGDQIAAKVPLRSQWGASEVGIPHQLVPTELGSEGWGYIRFHQCVGAVFEEVAPGVYELIIRRDDALAKFQTTWAIRGVDSGGVVYRSRDLFERHHSVPDAWRWRARADDIIVFLNGEKTNPVSMEQHVIASNPELIGAVVVGAQKSQAALLIEPKTTAALSKSQQMALIEQVWPSIEEANLAAPAHARVEKSFILVTERDRPLPRAGKGTIQRSAAFVQYQSEIERLYADADTVPGDDDAAGITIDPTNIDEITCVIRATICSITNWTDFKNDTNFFDRGMDSLVGLRLIRALRRALSYPTLSLSTIYRNHTLSELAAAISAQNDTSNDSNAMESLLATYTARINEISTLRSSTARSSKRAGATDVILTGSTGHVGTYILRSLLDRPGIGHVYCLNRRKDGGHEAQHERFVAAGFGTEDFSNRTSFVQVDTAHPKLGIEDSTYEALRGAQLLIHNAWPVNFNLPLSSFRPQLAGLVNLLALATSAAHPMRVIFVSSISAIAGRDPSTGPAPEVVLTPFDTPHAGGYPQSKFLGERLCEVGASQLAIPVTVVRVGQVAGPVRGVSTWSRDEWLPSQVISSVHLGCLPDSLGSLFSNMNFVPVDTLGETMVDFAMHENGDVTPAGANVFNVRNPHSASWTELIPAVIEAVREEHGKTLEVVSATMWLARLQDSERAAATDPAAAAAANPALKLLEFYRDSILNDSATKPQMSIEHALAASLALCQLPAISSEMMYKWVREWVRSASPDEVSS